MDPRWHMRRPAIFQLVVLLSLVNCRILLAAASPRLVVLEDHVNLRTGPGSDCEVVAQVSSGDVLTGRNGAEGEWLEVVPPGSVVFWVYADLVDNGSAISDALKVRGGPGINYRSVARLSKGDAVTVVGRDGDWLRIAPPPNSSLWISSKYVRIHSGDGIPASAPAPAVEIPTSRTWDPAMAAVPLASPAVGSMGSVTSSAPDLDEDTVAEGQAQASVLDPIPLAPSSARTTPHKPIPKQELHTSERGIEAGSRPPEPTLRIPNAAPARPSDAVVRPVVVGKPVTYEGTLRPAGAAVWRRPSQFRLVYQDRLDRTVTRCYVLGDERVLSSLEGQMVRLTGSEARVQGVRYPVVSVDTIVGK